MSPAADEVSYAEVEQLLEANGFQLDGLSGINRVFRRVDKGKSPLFVSVPVMDGKVRTFVLQAITAFVADVQSQRGEHKTPRARRRAS